MRLTDGVTVVTITSMPFKRYGVEWPDGTSTALIERQVLRAGGKPFGLFQHYKNYIESLWPEHTSNRWTDLMLREIVDHQFNAVMGPGCMAGDTRLFDPTTGKAPTMKELCESGIRPTVLTVFGSEKASVPWVKGIEDLFEVRLSDGQSFVCTGQHRVLTDQGFISVSDLLRRGFSSFRLPSISGNAPSVREPDALRLTRTIQDSQFYCHLEPRSNDAQLLREGDIFQCGIPSRAYVPERSRSERRGDPVCELEYSPCECDFFHPSKLDTFLRCNQEGTSLLFLEPSQNSSHASCWFQSFEQSLQLIGHSPPFEESALSSDSLRCRPSSGLYSRPLEWGLHTHITSVKLVGRGKFYDICVPRAAHYYAQGAFHHNSSFKSGTLAKIALADWSLFPECTTVLVSSTTIKELKQRIFAEITKLWEMADNRHGGDGWWPGVPLDYLTAISNDDIEEKRARDIRNGIIGVACVGSEGTFQGLGKFAGRKNRRVWCVSDEVQFMLRSFLDAQENLISNGPNLVPGIYPDDYPDPSERGMPIRGYKAVFVGNSNNTRPENSLHLVMAPPGGWGTFEFDGKTKVYNAPRVAGTCVECRCIILDGLDSPNNDYPGDTPRFPHLISKQRIAKYAPESEGYYSQGRGIVKLGLAGLKIITVELCDQFEAFSKDCVWDEETTKIGMLDAAYGGVGGDRCTAGALEFGKCLDGKQRLKLLHSIEVPVKMNPKKIPEDQIAEFCRDYWIKLGVEPENVFFDGRGRLALSFSQKWSPFVNVVDFGGKPSDRPAGPDLMVEDRITRRKRPKLAHEHFSKFVSELWWSVAFAVQGDQVRGLTRQIVEDAQPREWYKVKGDKVEIETKAEMKKRTGCSPDWADCFSGETLVITSRGEVQISKVEIGDFVLTPSGYFPVVETHIRTVDFTTKLEFSNGSTLEGKGSHRIFQRGSGWMSLDTIPLTVEVESVYDLPAWTFLNTFFTEAGNTGFKQAADTIKTRTGAALRRDFFTESSGVSVMGIFRKACVSIIKTAIGRITESRIWNSCRMGITRACTLRSALVIQSIGSSSCETTSMRLSRPRNGTDQKKEGIGTARTLERYGRTKNHLNANALSAALGSCPPRLEGQSFVLFGAETNSLGRRITIALRCALFVARDLLLTGIARRRTVPVIVRRSQRQGSKKVYNLTVAGPNVFYANGILAENCLVVGVEGARQKGFKITSVASPEHRKALIDPLAKLAEEWQQLQEDRLAMR